MPIIELDNVVFKRSTKTIFDHLNLSIDDNGITALMGPSGVGKTTLLQLITAQIKPHSGTVRVLGDNIHKLKRKALFELRKKIGVLFQNGGLLGDLTVFENVALPLQENTHLTQSMIRNLVLMKLEVVGLRGVCDQYPNALSGGMARRVSFARALALDPPILLFDEPFVGQDPISMGILMRLIKSCSKAMDTTSVVVSHDVEEVLSISDYVFLISQGNVVDQGKPEALRSNQTAYSEQFVLGKPDGPVPFHQPTQIEYISDLMQ